MSSQRNKTIVGALFFGAFSVISFSSFAQLPNICKGQVSHTYPDGQKSYATYVIATQQRYGDCFPALCPAPCPFPTAQSPKRKGKLVEPAKSNS